MPLDRPSPPGASAKDLPTRTATKEGLILVVDEAHAAVTQQFGATEVWLGPFHLAEVGLDVVHRGGSVALRIRESETRCLTSGPNRASMALR